MKYISGFVLFLAVLLPLGAHAETVLRIGEDISVDADQIVNGDYYVSVGPLGNTIMSGTVEEDMYAFGGSVTVNGAIGSDVSIVSGSSQLHATVTDDVRILAGETTIGDHVGGDLFVIAGKLTVLSTATVDGDIIFFGGDAEINGKVGGSVLGTSERIRIDGEVGEHVDVETASLTLGEKAVVKDFVTYESQDQLIRAQNAIVEGEVTHKEVPKVTPKTDARASLIPAFIGLFAALSLFLLFKKELQLLVQDIHVHPLKSGLIGFGVMLLAPVISLLLIATVLGMVVGIAGFAFVVVVYALSYALCGVVVGAFAAKLFTKKITVSLIWIIIGTFLLHALLLLPGVGVPLFILVLMITMGGISQYFYKLLA